jgi:long-chain acyl-CoA synthetase
LGPSGENIYPEEIEAVINENPNALESLAYELEGKLVARIHLNYEELDRQFVAEKLGEFQVKKRIQDLLEAIRQEVNNRVSSFSRITRVIEQTEPFEKTPTQKIKRFLYTN